jgi:four helix bundle protein
MFLQLAHAKLDAFVVSKEFVLSCCKATELFPSKEKFAMISQIRRAALSVPLNIAEGCSRKSVIERNQFYKVARGSVIEIDTAFDIAVKLSRTSREALTELRVLLLRIFQLLSKMI